MLSDHQDSSKDLDSSEDGDGADLHLPSSDEEDTVADCCDNCLFSFFRFFSFRV